MMCTERRFFSSKTQLGSSTCVCGRGVRVWVCVGGGGRKVKLDDLN